MRSNDTRATWKKPSIYAAALAVFAVVFLATGLFAPRHSDTASFGAAVVMPERARPTMVRDTTARQQEAAAALVAKPVLAPGARAAQGRKAGTGEASYYGREFAGRKTANGERFNPTALTAAHRSLPFGSKVRVTNVRNGRSVIVRINDRGPYAKDRLIDVSRTAAHELGMIDSGTAKVQLEVLA